MKKKGKRSPREWWTHTMEMRTMLETNIVTLNLQADEVNVLRLLLRERIKKLDKERLKAESAGRFVHPVAIRTLKKAKAISQRLEKAVAENANHR